MKRNNRQCTSCRYGWKSSNATYALCNYLELTGYMRNCGTYPTCGKYEKRKGGRKRERSGRLVEDKRASPAEGKTAYAG